MYVNEIGQILQIPFKIAQSSTTPLPTAISKCSIEMSQKESTKKFKTNIFSMAVYYWACELHYILQTFLFLWSLSAWSKMPTFPNLSPVMKAVWLHTGQKEPEICASHTVSLIYQHKLSHSSYIPSMFSRMFGAKPPSSPTLVASWPYFFLMTFLRLW